MEPMTAMLILGGISTALEIGRTIYDASARSEASEDLADQAKRNRAAAEKAAADIVYTSAYTAGQIRERSSRLAASQRLGFAMSGVDVTRGTALEIPAETIALSEQDATQVELNARLQAWGYRTQGAQFSAQAAAQQRALEVGQVSSILGGVGNILTSSGAAWERYQRLQADAAMQKYYQGAGNVKSGPSPAIK